MWATVCVRVMEVNPWVTSDVTYSFAELRDRAECIRLADVTKRIYFQGVFVCTCMSETLYPIPIPLQFTAQPLEMGISLKAYQ